MSARHLIAVGVMRFAIFSRSKPRSSSVNSGVLEALKIESGSEMQAQKAVYACPNLAYSGHADTLYNASMSMCVTSDTCRMIECTDLERWKRSSHLATSSGDTRRLDRSM